MRRGPGCLKFGSPLDKTAFIFGAQGAGTEAREALAASVQPLISDAQVRPRWVNIYSTWDIISGSLDYYDLPDRSNRHPVENIKDPKATTLLAAHVEYWRNEKLFEALIEALRPAAPPGHGATLKSTERGPGPSCLRTNSQRHDALLRSRKVYPTSNEIVMGCGTENWLPRRERYVLDDSCSVPLGA